MKRKKTLFISIAIVLILVGAFGILVFLEKREIERKRAEEQKKEGQISSTLTPEEREELRRRTTAPLYSQEEIGEEERQQLLERTSAPAP